MSKFRIVIPKKKTMKDKLWNRLKTCSHKNPSLYRKDRLGHTLYYPSYGKDTKMGWHLDHKKPIASGGSNHHRNLDCLQSFANQSIGARMKRKPRS